MMENTKSVDLKGYLLEERIGSGGFGAVYRARQTTIEREVAIKIILPGFANNPEFIRRFETEAHLVARLEHPHITPLHDFWRDPNGAYLVMRYLKGGSLREALQEGPYDLESTSRLLDQVAAAVSFAHRNDVIHRDIKPGNILLDEDGNAYLADFGIAKDLLNINGNRTSPDAVVGSLDYISPEQARGEPVTPRTDIYSLGVTLYEMITGEHPFKASSSIERLYKHINDPLPGIRNLPDDVRDTINHIIQTATAKDPEKRYPDVLALAVAFREGIGRKQTERDFNIVEQLTFREQEILALIASGMSNTDIAEKLVVTMATVKWHITQLYKKLGVRSRVQAIVRARELNLIINGGSSDSLSDLVQPGTLVSLPEPENPYKGLHAFQPTDARDFFGRDELTQKLIDVMRAKDPYYRFLAIVGPSGSGKSSLVKAGLIPALWKGKLPGSEKWFVVDMIPGTHPLDKLETTLIRVAANQAENLHEQLQRDDRGLLRVADIILPGDDTELVLVVDQFEEVFTLVDDEEARQKFLDLLRTAVSDVRSRVRVIITLRADYYDRPLHYAEFGDMLRLRMETVLPLTAKGLERAIRGPAERTGVIFEQGVVEQIVSDINYQAGALPLLQYALTELFDRREGRLITHKSYQQIGGTIGALANRASEIYSSLTPEGQELTRQMFLRLVTLGEGAEDTRRRASQVELLSLANNADLMEEIIDQFAAYRLFSLDHDPETRLPTVEVAHEAILREWDTLRQWLNESREDIRHERALARSAEDWQTHHREPSYLLHGSRLEQVEKWLETTGLILTPLERNFIAYSIEQRKQEQQAELTRQAREAALEQRSRNFLRGLVGIFALAALIAAGLTLFAFAQRSQAQSARAEAERSAGEFRSIALVFGARDALTNGQPDAALALAHEAINMPSPPVQAQNTFLDVATSTWIRQRFTGHSTRVWDAIYHPDGERIITTSWDGRAVIWDITTGQELQSFSADGRLLYAAVHPVNHHLIALGGNNATLRLWDTASGDVTELVQGTGTHTSPLFSADGSLLVTSIGNGAIGRWDMETLALQHTFQAHGPDLPFIPSIRFNRDGTLLITSALDGYVRIWDAETYALIREINQTAEGGAPAWVWTAQFVHNDEFVLSGFDFTVTLHNWRTGELIWSVQTPRLVQDIAITPDEQWFLVGMEGPPSTQLREMATGSVIRSYYGHNGRTQNLDISPDGMRFVTASVDGTAVEWPVWWEGTQTVTHIPGGNLALHPTLPLAAVTKDITQELKADGTIRIVNTETGEIVRELVAYRDAIDPETGEVTQERLHREHVRALTFTPDGRYLISGDYAPSYATNEIYIWDWESGEMVGIQDGHETFVRAIAVSPDGRLVASGDQADAQILIWELETQAIIHTLTDHDNALDALVFSPDGSRLYSRDGDGSVYSWDVNSGERLRTYGEGDGGASLMLIEGGTQLVAPSSNGTRIWDVNSGALLRRLDAGGYVATISPDESLLATMDIAGIRIYDLATGEEIFTRPLNQGVGAGWITFNSDRRLITTEENVFAVWGIPDTFEDMQSWALNSRYIPDFTCDQRALYQIEPLCGDDS